MAITAPRGTADILAPDILKWKYIEKKIPIKNKEKDTIIVAVGCYVQVAKDKLEAIPEIDLVLGNNEKQDIVKYVEEYIDNKNKVNNYIYQSRNCYYCIYNST